MFTWEMMLILFIGVIFLIFWFWEFLKKDSHYAVLFDKGIPYIYNFRTGKLLHSLAIIRVKGICNVRIYNSYTKRTLKKVANQKENRGKFVILFEKDKYFTLEIEEGKDFIVEVINFMPRC